MSISHYLSYAKEHLNNVGKLIPYRITLTTTQKVYLIRNGSQFEQNLFIRFQVVVISLSASVIVVGVLARYLRRKKRVLDPTQFRRNIFNSKRSRTSGMRSPNGGTLIYLNFNYFFYSYNTASFFPFRLREHCEQWP